MSTHRHASKLLYFLFSVIFDTSLSLKWAYYTCLVSVVFFGRLEQNFFFLHLFSLFLINDENIAVISTIGSHVVSQMTAFLFYIPQIRASLSFFGCTIRRVRSANFFRPVSSIISFKSNVYQDFEFYIYSVNYLLRPRICLSMRTQTYRLTDSFSNALFTLKITNGKFAATGDRFEERPSSSLD